MYRLRVNNRRVVFRVRTGRRPPSRNYSATLRHFSHVLGAFRAPAEVRSAERAVCDTGWDGENRSPPPPPHPQVRLAKDKTHENTFVTEKVVSTSDGRIYISYGSPRFRNESLKRIYPESVPNVVTVWLKTIRTDRSSKRIRTRFRNRSHRDFSRAYTGYVLRTVFVGNKGGFCRRKTAIGHLRVRQAKVKR